MSPFFSIIIPVYNVAPYLRECLDSVLAQTFTDWEAICVDDGSTDGSSVILDEYAARDPRFRVIHQPNAGVSAARNRGIALSQGRYLSILDSDDVIVSKWLATASRAIDETGSSIVRLWLTYWDGSTPTPVVAENHTYSIYEGGDAVVSWGWRVLLREGWSCLLFWKRESLSVIDGMYPLGIGLREDNIFLLRQIKNFSKVCQVGYAGYFYRQRKSSAVSSPHRKCEEKMFSCELDRLWRRDRGIIRKEPDYETIKILVEENIRDPFGRTPPSLAFRICRKLKRLVEKAIPFLGA